MQLYSAMPVPNSVIPSPYLRLERVIWCRIASLTPLPLIHKDIFYWFISSYTMQRWTVRQEKLAHLLMEVNTIEKNLSNPSLFPKFSWTCDILSVQAGATFKYKITFLKEITVFQNNFFLLQLFASYCLWQSLLSSWHWEIYILYNYCLTELFQDQHWKWNSKYSSA